MSSLIYIITFIEKSYYINVSFKDEKPKGLRSVASVASRLISEDEHLVVCIKTCKKRQLFYSQHD